MFDNLEVMRMASGLAAHASTRQNIVARNIANADTPDFRARDAVPFAELYESRHSGGLRATRERHLVAAEGADDFRTFEIAAQASPNGNTVSLETEMMRSADVRHQHDMATAIYKSSLDVLRMSISRR